MHPALRKGPLFYKNTPHFPLFYNLPPPISFPAHGPVHLNPVLVVRAGGGGGQMSYVLATKTEDQAGRRSCRSRRLIAAASVRVRVRDAREPATTCLTKTVTLSRGRRLRAKETSRCPPPRRAKLNNGFARPTWRRVTN